MSVVKGVGAISLVLHVYGYAPQRLHFMKVKCRFEERFPVCAARKGERTLTHVRDCDVPVECVML